jgi:hypothetical protein
LAWTKYECFWKEINCKKDIIYHLNNPLKKEEKPHYPETEGKTSGR